MSDLAAALAAWLSASVGAAGLWSLRSLARHAGPPLAVLDIMVAIIITVAGLQLAAMLFLRMLGKL